MTGVQTCALPIFPRDGALVYVLQSVLADRHVRAGRSCGGLGVRCPQAAEALDLRASVTDERKGGEMAVYAVRVHVPVGPADLEFLAGDTVVARVAVRGTDQRDPAAVGWGSDGGEEQAKRSSDEPVAIDRRTLIPALPKFAGDTPALMVDRRDRRDLPRTAPAPTPGLQATVSRDGDAAIVRLCADQPVLFSAADHVLVRCRSAGRISVPERRPLDELQLKDQSLQLTDVLVVRIAGVCGPDQPDAAVQVAWCGGGIAMDEAEMIMEDDTGTHGVLCSEWLELR